MNLNVKLGAEYLVQNCLGQLKVTLLPLSWSPASDDHPKAKYVNYLLSQKLCSIEVDQGGLLWVFFFLIYLFFGRETTDLQERTVTNCFGAKNFFNYFGRFEN